MSALSSPLAHPSAALPRGGERGECRCAWEGGGCSPDGQRDGDSVPVKVKCPLPVSGGGGVGVVRAETSPGETHLNGESMLTNISSDSSDSVLGVPFDSPSNFKANVKMEKFVVEWYASALL